jgi:membrane protease YdiL (CAAX protease family)
MHLDKQIISFVLILLLLSWAVTFFIHFFGLSQNPMSLVMILPLILVLVFMLSSKKERFSSIGWRIPHLKYIAIGIFLPLVQVSFVISIGLILKIVSFNPQHTICKRPTPYLWLNLLICIPALFIPFILLSWPRFIFGWLSHMSEEIAWRGYLFRKIAIEKKSLKKAVFISGVVWWAWHVPMFLFSPVLRDLGFGFLALTAALALFSLVGTSFVYSWVYIQSGSIWAPTIMHLFWNLFRGIFTGRLSDGEPGLFVGNLWLINGEGIIGMVVMVFSGLIFYLLTQRIEMKKEWLRSWMGLKISNNAI